MKHLLHRCEKHGRLACWWCITQSVAFPVEHFMWEKVWPLTFITKALGL